MNNFRLNVFLAALFATALSASLAASGEVLLSENFDSINLEELPPNWTKAEPAELDLQDEAGRGKVLKLSNKDEHYPFLMYTLDPAKAAGRTLTVSIASKFPGSYIPIADKLWASPKLAIEAKDAQGKMVAELALVPQAGKPDWQELKKDLAIPADSVSITAQITIQFVTCEVFFDDFKIEASGAAAPAPIAVTTNPTAPPVPVIDPDNPKALAEKAPKKTFDDGGLTFGPDYALRLQKTFPSKSVTAETALFIGPGFSEKEPQPKLNLPWHALPANAKLSGSSASPRILLTWLPEVLVKEKPEVVFISSDAAPGRKPSSSEAEDWDDVANLCLRFNALPVFIPHPNDGKEVFYDRIAKALDKTISSHSYLTVSPVPSDAFVKRTGNLLTLLDTHVFLRVKPAEAGKTVPSGKRTDE